jgi:hypothetical protein
MPEMDLWTYSQFGLDGEEGERIQRVGINFGAPGDRRAPDGTLWLEYPDTSEGISPGVGIKVEGANAKYFRRHTSQVNGDGLAWVGASGLVGAETVTITPTLIKPAMKSSSSKGKDKDEDDDKSSKSGSKSEKGAAAAVVKESKSPDQSGGASSLPSVPYTVRLHFAEPDEMTAGTRVFTVSLQGEPVLKHFDITAAAGGSGRTVVKEFPHVLIGPELSIRLTPESGTAAGAVLCGVELIAEKRTASAAGEP